MCLLGNVRLIKNHDVSVNEFNLHFGLPCSDTCDTCDSLKIRIDATEVDEERDRLESELKDHQTLAEEAYASLRKDCELSKESWSQVNNKRAEADH